MAASADFQNRVKEARSKDGGQSHKSEGPKLMGGGAWDQQVAREEKSFNSDAVSGSRGAENIAAYANVSKQATSANGSFSKDQADKWSNSARDQANVNKQQEADSNFSGQRIENNVNYANENRKNNISNNEGFSMNTTNSFINNAKDHREDNTAKATEFADRTVDKYLHKNKQWQTTDVAKLDQTIRQAPLVDEANAKKSGLNTFGDMYSYGRNKLPKWTPSDSPNKVEQPDFKGMYDQTTKDIKAIEI